MKRYLWGFGFSNLGLEAKSQLSRRQDSTFVSYGDYSSFYKNCYDWKSWSLFIPMGLECLLIQYLMSHIPIMKILVWCDCKIKLLSFCEIILDCRTPPTWRALASVAWEAGERKIPKYQLSLLIWWFPLNLFHIYHKTLARVFQRTGQLHYCGWSSGWTDRTRFHQLKTTITSVSGGWPSATRKFLREEELQELVED